MCKVRWKFFMKRRIRFASFFNCLKQNVDLLLESDGVEFTLKFFSYDRLKSLVVNCAALTSNKATTRHKKVFRNAIWL